MKAYLKALTLLLAVSGSVYLPKVYAANSTTMLITIAETSPALVERLNTIALSDSNLLNSLLMMAESDPEQLERLLDLYTADPVTFQQLTAIIAADATQGESASVLGIDDGNGIIRD